MSRVALVTGGSRGIGRACSVALQGAGYRVAANYGTNREAAERFGEEAGLPVYRWDVSDYAACEEGLAQVVRELGPIEILVNNAGISRDRFMHKMPREQWHEVIDTNLNSCFNMCRLVIGSMRERGFGRIVNISSMNGLAGALGETSYDASKAGMIGLTKALALESARRNVTVNAVAPGYIETDMVSPAPAEWLEDLKQRIPVGRLGQPEEIGRAVVFLAADEAGFITGATLSVNGGQHLH